LRYGKSDDLDDLDNFDDLDDLDNLDDLEGHAPPGADRQQHPLGEITKMKALEQVLDSSRSKMRLAEIERLIRKHRIITPPLSRQTLVTMCEDGTFETAGSAPTKLGWLVYEDSFLKWVKSLDSGLDK
jgi:hypothetical protein